ncbi:MAG: OmpH family outer membrane protein [Sphingomonadaceae bacterium]
MTKILTTVAGLALALALGAGPANAQAAKKAAAPAPTAGAANAAPRATLLPGVGTADLQVAVANTNAYRAAAQQRQSVYKPTYDAAQARAKYWDDQIQPKMDKLNADIKAKAPDAQLEQQAREINKLQGQGEADVKQMLVPSQLSEEYVVEQISEKLPQAVQNVLGRRGISLLLAPDSVLVAAPQYDLTGAIVAELNVLVPSVQITPPTGWQPRRVREAQAAQQQQAGAARPAGTPAPAPAATPPKPAGPQPEGR